MQSIPFLKNDFSSLSGFKAYFSIGALAALVFSCNSEKADQKPNVLFIAIDDLRPVLGSYGHDIHSPAIDQVASEGVQFNRAYCNVPVCGASRASLLTGIRPLFPDRFINYLSWAEKDTPGVLSMPEHFKNNGYTTISIGKVFHHRTDMTWAWSAEPWMPDTFTYIRYADLNYTDSSSLNYINPRTGAGPYFEASNAPDSLYFDNKVTAKAIKDMKMLAEEGKPFFLAVGFHKPHLPFTAPKRYFDMYENVKIAENRFTPEDLPEQVKNSREIFTYGRLDHYNTLEFHHEARKAYYACVSYIDDLVGEIMSNLKKLGLEKNTIVVIYGDHGWHLGEHNFWGKHNILHNALHCPLIIKAPGMKPGKIQELVEFVDIYPTLCQLAGLEIPSHLQGSSMVNLMTGKPEGWKNIAVCEWSGARTLLTDGYSYSYWFEEKHNNARCLFDHSVDPDENKNVADNTDYKEIINQHQAILDSVYSTLLQGSIHDN
jgi:iduronate 2-sulfatase